VSSTDGDASNGDTAGLTGLVVRAAVAFSLEGHQPLHQRAPARDEHGHALGDFMILIPGLRDRPRHELAERIARLQVVLLGFTEVVFLDLNLRLNLLWVSVRPRPGVILELFGAVRLSLPEARLVGQRQE
jgi:hypothetical protein